MSDRLRREVDPQGIESATAIPRAPIVIRRVIERGFDVGDAEVIRSVHAAALEALRERDRAEGREPYPPANNRVLSISIELYFVERVDAV